RRMKLKNLPQIIGADLSELEWATPQAQSEKPKLTGTRGRIIQIWRRWARHHEAAGFVRASGETAAELARRIDSAAAPTPEREAITRILEAAHYAGDDPPEELVEQMKTLVDAEMAEEGRRAKRS
ncbi:DUF4129 domain-containing protein, partial [Candidatus Sumerlaeota bacterium]|nr:DUF4129 domain-containing protein [Candidatus Sumerlaeota bacterium]